MDIQRSGPKRRKRSPDRISQIVDLAEQQILETGSLPLAMNLISDAMGTSRALVYAYFSDPDALVETVLLRHFGMLIDQGLEETASKGAIDTRAVACANIYLRHVASRGNVIHNILREVPRGVRLSKDATGLRNRLLRQLAGAARRDLVLRSDEALVFIAMLVAIPEELGRLVRRNELDLPDALGICERLVLSAVAGLRPDDLPAKLT